MTDATPSSVLERPEPGIAVLRLNRPDRLNALEVPGVRLIHDQLDEVARDSSVRVLILTGAGKGFCAGLDLKAMQEGGAASRSVREHDELQTLFANLALRLRSLEPAVIAAVNGVAVGAGMAMTLAADIRLAASTASFHIGAVKIGITAGECGISYHLPRLVGASRAFEVMLTGRPVAADEALRIGLVADVVEPAQLMDRALACARQILGNSPYATRHTKRLMWANLDAPSLQAAIELENHAQVLGLMTEDFHEATSAFAQKRKPVFTGR